MKLTRKQLLAGTAAGVVGAGSIYELVDLLAGTTPARTATPVRFPEQHLLDGIRVVHSDKVEVLVPPLHHEILTARLAVGRADARDAQRDACRRAQWARRRLSALTRRARRDGGVGEALLRGVRSGCLQRA